MNSPIEQAHFKRGLLSLLLAGINMLAVLIFLGERTDLVNPVWIYLSLYTIAFGFYVYASRKADSLAQLRPNNRLVFSIIILFAIAFRLVLVHSVPSLSTDMYRYVWDGRLSCHWINPYRWSPWDPRLAAFRDPTIWGPMEYKAYATVYMPVSQLFFAICYALFRTNLFGYKLIFTLFEIGIVFLVAQLLKLTGKDVSRVIWYAWCPLPVIETSLAGHQDVIGIFFMLLALVLAAKKRNVLSGMAIAAGAMTKGFALLIIPLLSRFGNRRALISAVLALFYLSMPAWVYLPEFLHGMGQYLDNVHVNSGIFTWLDWSLGWVTKYHFLVTSRLAGLAVLAATCWSCVKQTKNIEEVIRKTIVVIAVCILTVPTLFPWYVIWILPLVAVFGNKPAASIVMLAFTVDLVYVYYIDRVVHWWIPLIEYLPVFALIVYELKKGYWLSVDPVDDEPDLVPRSGGVDLGVATPALSISRGVDAT